jgi:hypothetical protein
MGLLGPALRADGYEHPVATIAEAIVESGRAADLQFDQLQLHGRLAAEAPAEAPERSWSA